MSELAWMALLPLQLRLVREAAGLSQRELGIRSGVGEKSISSFETGARIEFIKLAQLTRIADACHVTLVELLAAPEVELSPVVAVVPFPPPQSSPKRGITIFRSSDHLQSSLGEARR
jgi:transcriptional regulator with XRE-family HTH domain